MYFKVWEILRSQAFGKEEQEFVNPSIWHIADGDLDTHLKLVRISISIMIFQKVIVVMRSLDILFI